MDKYKSIKATDVKRHLEILHEFLLAVPGEKSGYEVERVLNDMAALLNRREVQQLYGDNVIPFRRK